MAQSAVLTKYNSHLYSHNTPSVLPKTFPSGQVSYLHPIQWESIENAYNPVFLKNKNSRFILNSNISLLEKRLTQFSNYIEFRFAGKISLITNFLINTEYVNSIQKIYLFGSYAYGQPHADSDMDFCAVIDSDKSWVEVACGMTTGFWDERIIPVNLLVFNEKQFSERVKELSIEKVVYEHGVLVYERK